MAIRKKISYAVTRKTRGSRVIVSGDVRAAAPPVHPDADFRRGNTLFNNGQYQEALICYDRVIKLVPSHFPALINRGAAYAQSGQFHAALTDFDRAIALQPDNADIHCMRAGVLRALNQYDAMLAAYDDAIRLRPDFAHARFRRGVCKLLTGRYTEGWQDYEARWDEWAQLKMQAGQPQTLLGPDNFGKPLWDGSSTKDTLLIWAEQGLGDQILFASMLLETAARAGRIILALEQRLHPLFARSFPSFEIITFAQALKRGGYQQQIPMGSLGALLRNRADDFLSHRRPYLAADAKHSAALRKTIATSGKRIVGLSWRSTNKEYGTLKSMPLATLRPLLETPGLHFVDLQYGDTKAERAALHQRGGPDITHLDTINNQDNLDGLAALINACDVIVTISNTTAHLAGALGKPVLLMLPHAAGHFWYWQTDRDDTLWYDHVRLFRQRTAGDWAEVIKRVRTALATGNTTVTHTITHARKPRAAAADFKTAIFKTAIRDSLAMLQKGETKAARRQLEHVIEAMPKHAEALQLLGGILLLDGKPAEAAAFLERTLAVSPAIALGNLGLVLHRLKHDSEALAQFEKAAAIEPDYAEAHSNCGVILNDMSRFAEAVTAYDRAVAIKPGFADAHCNRGVALNNLNRHAEAVASYDRAIALKPGYAAAHWNRCLALLTSGDFKRGWDQYAWRWKKREITSDDLGKRPFWYGNRQRRGKHDLPHGVPCAFDPPFWDGTPNRDSLLVWPEQGVGEQVLYSSILNDTRARVGKLTLILQQKLHPLFQRSFPECRIVTFETAVAENNFDWQIPLGELGRFFRTFTDDFLRRRQAYLKADPARTAALRTEIAPKRQRIVGLSWYSRNAEFGVQKTLSLDLLAPLLATPGLRFVDLQYGDTDTARAAIRRNTGIDITRVASVDNWEDVDGFAALVNACDLIVTISNSTAHIAGALGKDVLLMLPHSQGRFWFWQNDRDDTLFYPGVRVFRQHASGDWSEVIKNVCAAAASQKLKSGKT